MGYILQDYYLEFFCERFNLRGWDGKKIGVIWYAVDFSLMVILSS
jgi:hypothetical protein